MGVHSGLSQEAWNVGSGVSFLPGAPQACQVWGRSDSWGHSHWAYNAPVPYGLAAASLPCPEAAWVPCGRKGLVSPGQRTPTATSLRFSNQFSGLKK